MNLWLVASIICLVFVIAALWGRKGFHKNKTIEARNKFRAFEQQFVDLFSKELQPLVDAETDFLEEYLNDLTEVKEVFSGLVLAVHNYPDYAAVSVVAQSKTPERDDVTVLSILVDITMLDVFELRLPRGGKEYYRVADIPSLLRRAQHLIQTFHIPNSQITDVEDIAEEPNLFVIES